jgi:MFS transporter, PAT family, beta-lactamase induction signal transducer AmpG
MNAYLEIFRSRRVAVVFLLGFASGLPLALTGGTLQAWMAVSGVDIATIGIFTLVGIPYTWKFLWSPFLDRYVPPFLGRRRGWIVVMQLALMATITTMGSLNPATAPWALAGLAIIAAFASSSQDIAIDAYRTELLKPAERGLGAAASVLGYRLAMVISGALALIMADTIGWDTVYYLMAGLMGLLVLATLWAPEPEVEARPPKTMTEAVIEPFKEFFSRKEAWLILLLIVLYKLGDAFAGSLTTTFLIRGVDFSPAEVGAYNKGMGLIATLIGVAVGGGLMIRLGLFWSLMLFGIAQAISNLSFMWLAAVGKNYLVMATAVGVENLTGGMGTAAFVALLMSLCNPRFTASQYALLSALAAVGRVYVGPLSGTLVEQIGWETFFGFTFVVALPCLVLLWGMRKNIESLDHGQKPG